MSNFSELNKKHTGIKWEYNTEDFDFKKCSKVELDTELPIHGVFITQDNGYGEGCCAILDDCILSLPQRYNEDVREILNDDGMVNAIKENKVSIKVTTFISKKYKKTGYEVEWIEKEV